MKFYYFFDSEYWWLWSLILILVCFIFLSYSIIYGVFYGKLQKNSGNFLVKSRKNQEQKKIHNKSIKFWQKNIDKRIAEQLPLFCRALSEALNSGYNMEHALRFVISELPEPLRSILDSLPRDLDLNRDFITSLESLQKYTDQRDFAFFIKAVSIQYKSGGSMGSLLKNIAENIETRAKIEADLQSFTAQGRMSGYFLIGLFPTSLLLFHWMSPAHTQVLWSTTSGNLLFGTAVLLEVLGALMIWKILNPKI